MRSMKNNNQPDIVNGEDRSKNKKKHSNEIDFIIVISQSILARGTLMFIVFFNAQSKTY